MKIGIATPVLIDGDAVGNDVVNQYLSLKKKKHEVYLFAEHAHVSLMVSNIKNIKKILNNENDIYIYHHSIYCEQGVRALEELKCRKIVKYHNITPPAFFQSNSHIAKECQKGLDQLSEIVKYEIWSDSEFNGKDLRKVDSRVEFTVLPPYNQVGYLNMIRPDHQCALDYNDWNANIIMVGRVASNKNIMLGVRAFHHHINNHNKNARLLVVGDNGSSYAKEVNELIQDLNLSNKVIMTGKVSAEALKAFYLIADTLLVTSTHEGFCVPIVEAMAFSVPVVASKIAAIPYTAGDAAIFVSDSDPVNISDGIKESFSKREQLIIKGRERFKANFENLTIENNLYQLIEKSTCKTSA